MATTFGKLMNGLHLNIDFVLRTDRIKNVASNFAFFTVDSRRACWLAGNLRTYVNDIAASIDVNNISFSFSFVKQSFQPIIG